MAYVYRYIDIIKEEVVYVGKVTKNKNENYDPLTNRHNQHKRDEWYKSNPNNIAMQYIENLSPVDADILESWLISYYDTDQLANKGKTGWGKSDLDLSKFCDYQWKNYGNFTRTKQEIFSMVYSMVDRLINLSDGLRFNLNYALTILNNEIRELSQEVELRDKAQKLNGYSDYKRRYKEIEPAITTSLEQDQDKLSFVSILGHDPFEELKRMEETHD